MSKRCPKTSETFIRTPAAAPVFPFLRPILAFGLLGWMVQALAARAGGYTEQDTISTTVRPASQDTTRNLMTIHLVSLSSDICEDHPEEGIGASTGCGYSGEKIGETFATFPEMLAYLKNNYGLSSNEADYGVDCSQSGRKLHYSKTVANHSEAQNGGWFEPTPEELEQWRAGTLKLYSEDYVINWHEVA